jgi:acyl homoserine lactone synthase
MIEISIARAGEGALSAALMDSMFRLRTEVFCERLGWDVRVEQGREHDWFDLIGPRYLVAHTPGSAARAVGCCRLLPSQGPNMLR